MTNTFDVGFTSGLMTSTIVSPFTMAPVPASELPPSSVAATNWVAIRVPKRAKPFSTMMPRSEKAFASVEVEKALVDVADSRAAKRLSIESTWSARAATRLVSAWRPARLKVASL